MILIRTKFITVDRDIFLLTLWRFKKGRYRPQRVYPIAVGMLGHETPTGMKLVESKTRTPKWKVPDSDWVREHDPPLVPGTIYDFEDPINPFAGGFISIDSREGIGIHGTKFEPRVGEAVSHGCIRMGVHNLKDLYGRVPVGTPVFIHGGA